MSEKKSTPSKKRKPTRAGLRKQLARNIAAILANPETPVRLYNEISDCVMEFESVDHSPLESADNIERALDTYARFEASRTKGGRR
jgi:hypothetical protein